LVIETLIRYSKSEKLMKAFIMRILSKDWNLRSKETSRYHIDLVPWLTLKKMKLFMSVSLLHDIVNVLLDMFLKLIVYWWILKQKAVYRWILEPAERDAVLANVAIKSGKNYNVIVEISAVLSPEELLNVRRAYVKRYKHSLEEDLSAHTSGHLRQASPFSINASNNMQY